MFLNNDMEEIRKFSGADFASHYMRKSKSALYNSNYINKMVRHANDQENYRNDNWSVRK